MDYFFYKLAQAMLAAVIGHADGAEELLHCLSHRNLIHFLLQLDWELGIVDWDKLFEVGAAQRYPISI